MWQSVTNRQNSFDTCLIIEKVAKIHLVKANGERIEKEIMIEYWNQFVALVSMNKDGMKICSTRKNEKGSNRSVIK